MTIIEPDTSAGVDGPPDAFASLLTARPHHDAIGAARLGEPAVLTALLERFRADLAAAESVALGSLWSQFYFGRLIVPAIALIAGGGGSYRLALEAVNVRFCPHQGIPLSFHLVETVSPRDPAAAVSELVDGHIGPLVSILQRQAGLSKRLLWANAGWSLAWAAGQIDGADGEGTRVRRALTETLSHFPYGRPTGRGVPLCRRVCCLRHKIAGYARCPGICPLQGTEARQA